MQTISDQIKKEYYKALLDKNSNYENIFFVGVKTTGVFCRPSCPARKPKYENCEFFQTAQQALIASFRPCIRCKPLSHPNHVSNLVKKLLDAIESAPEKRWKNSDLEELSVDCSTARRQFKKRFGMTFIEYARARRMGIAMKYIKHGDPIIYAQLEAGYESSSGFRDAFTKIMGALPSQSKNKYNVLKASWLDTPLGPMVAISDEKLLYLLEFADRRGLEREIECLRKKTNSAIIPGRTIPIESIEQELKLYFSGQLRKFSTPLFLLGSAFQKLAWQALIEIPYGETRSYIEQAKIINLPSACRAIANANGANQISIVIPCHRIINHNGELGGYGGGLARKKWLIEHEQKNLAGMK